ncbi:MAG: Sjogren's syndrome/scleroderma autoantigen 1 family protein [Candidatus Kariarchaeaceae archaeon]
MSDNRESVKRMADLLKSGATMLFEHCPQCNSPLFKIENETWCPSCNKQVVTVKEGKNVEYAMATFLETVEERILTKIEDISQQLSNEQDLLKLTHLSNLISVLLDILTKTKKFHQ